MSNIADIAGFIAKNGIPVLAAGETMGKVAADFVDILVNDLLYDIIKSCGKKQIRR